MNKKMLAVLILVLIIMIYVSYRYLIVELNDAIHVAKRNMPISMVYRVLDNYFLENGKYPSKLKDVDIYKDSVFIEGKEYSYHTLDSGKDFLLCISGKDKKCYKSDRTYDTLNSNDSEYTIEVDTEVNNILYKKK